MIWKTLSQELSEYDKAANTSKTFFNVNTCMLKILKYPTKLNEATDKAF